MSNHSLPRMRILSEAYEELRALDPATNISRNYIRKLILSGQIATVQVGRKRLINFENLLEFLNRDNSKPITQDTHSNGSIRRIS